VIFIPASKYVLIELFRETRSDFFVLLCGGFSDGSRGVAVRGAGILYGFHADAALGVGGVEGGVAVHHDDDPTFNRIAQSKSGFSLAVKGRRQSSSETTQRFSAATIIFSSGPSMYSP
jgi:hypothetical protein